MSGHIVPLHANPTARRDVFATPCQGCGADVILRRAKAVRSHDRVAIPEIKPDVDARGRCMGGVARVAPSASRPTAGGLGAGIAVRPNCAPL